MNKLYPTAARSPSDAAFEASPGWRIVREMLISEPLVRAWLRKALRSEDDVDDVLQDAYCRIAALPNVSHIERPTAFFFGTARNLVRNRARRSKIVAIETGLARDAMDVADTAPSPEDIVAARLELAQIEGVIGELPDRCRRVFRLRRLEGLPQRAIAETLGVSETIVENDAAKGMRALKKAMETRDQRHMRSCNR